MTEIYSATIETPIGFLKISGTTAAILSVLFVEEAVTPGVLPAVLEQCISELKEYFSGKRTQFGVPLAAEGSDFQKQVWESLCKIPYGSTVTYGHVAKSLQNPDSIRAVGNANGRNPIAIIVPCHRVIGANGSLVGYSGKLWRKDWLLEHEAAIAHGIRKLF